MAGGLSTRLYPLTKSVPKPLVPVAGVPNAAHLMHYLKAYGFDEIAINVHYLADAIVETLGDGSRFGVKLHYSHEPELLGSAGAREERPKLLRRRAFVVIGCDEVTDLRLDELLAFHREREAIATIGLVEREEVDQYGVVVLDERAKIVGFQEKPAKGTERSKLANTGVYVFSPAIFEHIPAGEFYDFGKQVFPALQSGGRARSTASTRAARIGPTSARRASTAARATTSCAASCASRRRIRTASIRRRRSRAGVRIEGPVQIGAGVRRRRRLDRGPERLRRWRAHRTGRTIERSILWQGATIGARRSCATRSSATTIVVEPEQHA